MATESIELSRVLPTTPERIYLAWLSGLEHSAMTGSKATVESIEVGGAYSAWDGYIDGVHVALEPGRRILQTWRSDDFPADAAESYLEVLLEPAPGGTRITLRHTGIPEGQGPGYLDGWGEHYLTPMARFFAAEARRTRPAPARTGAGKKAAKKSPARRAPARKRVAAGRSSARKTPGRKPPRTKASARKAGARSTSRKRSPKPRR
jgi:uncharacterized protein YndB with AHSA1/START domain